MDVCHGLLLFQTSQILGIGRSSEVYYHLSSVQHLFLCRFFGLMLFSIKKDLNATGDQEIS